MTGVPETLVPHRAPMLFLDRIIAISDTEVTAETVCGPQNPLHVAGRGLPGYVGLEMMAQAVAAVDGQKRTEAGSTPKIGFLLGCRRYSVACESFADGTVLRINAKMVFSDGEMFSFECRIDGEDGKELARANMNVYAPADPEAFLAKGGAA
ncbi:MAG TPA: hypothetical protein VHU87_14955 [Rhizomicrobium sp.]|jgi:predicted hotdog family 3-hydroxylacyl-ACP dehydratase|nr:hypothetical protein [Rhizomicrobium sp.]